MEFLGFVLVLVLVLVALSRGRRLDLEIRELNLRIDSLSGDLALLKKIVTSRQDLWKGTPLYVGRANLGARRTRTEDPRSGEWITRDKAPSP